MRRHAGWTRPRPSRSTGRGPARYNRTCPTRPRPRNWRRAFGAICSTAGFPPASTRTEGTARASTPRSAPTGDAAKGLVFQSRMVWVCASVAPQRPEFADYARHGVRFLKNRLRDRRTGAFLWSTRRRGGRAPRLRTRVRRLRPRRRRSPSGRRRGARRGEGRLHAYLEAYHHDDRHGGYFEATDASGKPILAGPGKGDLIGTPYGQKSQNTHLHLMEAYAELYRAWPDPLVRERLTELVAILGNRLFAEPGHLTLFAAADWTPASTAVSYGHDIEAAHLLLDAADALSPVADPFVLRRARALADATLTEGGDAEAGGIFYAGRPERADRPREELVGPGRGAPGVRGPLATHGGRPATPTPSPGSGRSSATTRSTGRGAAGSRRPVAPRCPKAMPGRRPTTTAARCSSPRACSGAKRPPHR